MNGLISELPGGLDTRVGEGGRRLSLGQAQRVALARTMLSHAPLLVFDEPTAHLDGETERVVSEAMEQLTRDRTAVIISHRDRPVSSADRTYRLEQGRLVAVPPSFGTKPVVP